MVKFKDIIFDKTIAIHCPEEWMANELLRYADSKGYCWKYGERYTDENEWNNYKEDTCYRIATGRFYYLFGYEKEFEKDAVKILHYNDVVIKEENNMETSFKYELKIKGRKADIGSKLFLDNEPITIVGVSNISSIIGIEYTTSKTELKFMKLAEADSKLSWEKPIIYQLPDTEGNLSEVKIGQIVYSIGNKIKHISKLEDNKIYVSFHTGEIVIYENITGKSKHCHSIVTNKPKRDFSPYFNFDEAPNGYDFGAVDNDGNAWWFKGKPNQLLKSWNVDNYNFESAGFRQNLINPETGLVDDWQDSLVKRSKETK